MITGFFLGVLASIVAAEIYLWLPAVQRFVAARGESAAVQRSPRAFLYRAAHRASGTGVGVLLMSVFVASEAAKRSRLAAHSVRLALEAGLMTAAVIVSFFIRYDSIHMAARDLSTPLLVIVPLQMLGLRAVGVRDPFRATYLRDLRFLILGFLLSTLPLWMLSGMHLPSFMRLGIPRSVLIINLDIAILLFVGVALTKRLLAESLAAHRTRAQVVL